MTQKLYLDESYQTAFEARVVLSRALDDGTREVVLDRTLFYPESGGQLADSGLLGSGRVTDVREAGDDTVVHIVTGDVPGGEVSGRVDWERRFDHMQQHTGQHVLSRAFIQAASLPTVSFHMGDETCTIDLEGTGFDENAVKRAEDLANRIIEENRPIDIRSVPVAELDQQELRRKVPEGVTIARIVSVRDFDAIPCCGTHVRTTGELGLVKVLRAERVKHLNRVHFKVGQRALDDYREKHAIVQSLANRLTTSPADLLAKIERMTEESQAAGKQAKRLIQRLAESQAGALLQAAARLGSRRVVLHRESDAALVRALASVLQNEPGTVAVLGADDGTVVCAAARDVTIDLATFASATAR
ncbi:MAG TPA: alanyl-tRNA editing protein, partial [Candidatus Krumholzibacteria bacterium]|nr:alanyl-tRNA editing protein [Candidatus Krumholzibacteria bacterium]